MMGKVKNLLKEITDPMSGYSILEVGIIEKIITKGKNIVVRVNLPKYSHALKDYIVGEIKNKLIALPGIHNVMVQVSTKALKYPFV
ncbi:MAG: iron-sulfur cluster assembly protein [archaeon]